MIRPILLPLALLGCLALAPLAGAQTTRPALTQLDQELQSLYREIDAGTVRVLLSPVQVGQSFPDHPLNKWAPALDRDIRRALLRQLQEHEALRLEMERRRPTTTESSIPPVDVATIDPNDPTKVVLDPDVNLVEHIALLLDQDGYAVLPTYLDTNMLQGRPLTVIVGQDLVDAELVGSDRQTHLSVLKLARSDGDALPLRSEGLAKGELVLLVAPTRNAARLETWTGGQNAHGVVVTMDGRVAGVVRAGQVLPADAVRMLAQQIIDYGAVRRATLGVEIAEIPMGDPLRRRDPAIGARPVLHVNRVILGSAADKAGLRPGDAIIAVAGEPVTDLTGFAAAIALRRGPTDLLILRNGEEHTVTADLQLAP